MTINHHEEIIQNMQVNVETDINNRFSLFDQKLQSFNPPNSDRGQDTSEIQQKLVEQN